MATAYSVQDLTREETEGIVDILAPNNRRVEVYQGASASGLLTIAFDEGGKADLSALPEGSDGHIDAEGVMWIDGAAFPVQVEDNTYTPTISLFDLVAAGIDTTKAHLTPAQLGEDEWIITAEGVKVAIGRAVDMEQGGTYGYDLAVYDAEGEQIRQDWYEDMASALAVVAKALTAEAADL
jgi:hypothetical protein